MRLNHNLASLSILRTYNKVLEKGEESLQRISSGYKVNNAKESPNAIAKSERIRMQIRGLQMAGKNSQDGVSMLQTAEGGLDGMTGMLQRVRELVVKGSNGTTTSSDRKIIQNEIDSTIDGMNDMAKNTEFNGVNILNAASNNENPLRMPIGANAGEEVLVPIHKLTSDALTVSVDDTEYTLDDIKSGKIFSLNTSSSVSSGGGLQVIDAAIDKIVSVRSEYGALENRFDSGLTNINEISDSMEVADSDLRDTDIAKEIMEYSKDNILSEAGNAMMAQSNKFPQEVLRILENVK